MEIVLGTYEQFLLGYRLQVDAENKKQYNLTESFAMHQHTGSIKCVAVQESGKLLVSGSSDELVQLYDIHKRVVTTALAKHEGTVTCVEFVKNSHLLSGGEDGDLLVWKTGSWICEKTLPGHKGGVVSVAVHPKGGLALSTGQDKALKTWNLSKGRTGFIVNLRGVGESLKFSESGDHFSLLIDGKLDVYSTEIAGVVCNIACSKKIISSIFLNDSLIVVGLENGALELHNMKTKECVWRIDSAHSCRVKAVCSCPATKNRVWLTSASSDGVVRVWMIKDVDSSKAPKLIAETETGCRITCMEVCLPFVPKKEEKEIKIEEKECT